MFAIDIFSIHLAAAAPPAVQRVSITFFIRGANSSSLKTKYITTSVPLEIVLGLVQHLYFWHVGLRKNGGT